MKISFRDRVILTIGALLAIFAGLLLPVWCLRRAPDFAPDEPAGWVRALCAVIGVLAALSGAYLLFFFGRRSERRADYVTQKTDSGELRIAVKAVERLALKCVALHDELRLQDMAVRSGRGGVTVELTVTVANNISIPLAVAALQKQIKQYLSASSGVDVREVRVSVAPSEEEWEAAPAGEENAAGEDRAGLDRRPLHQRLFSPASQPMTLPEPPLRETGAAHAGRPPETESARPLPADAPASPEAPRAADTPASLPLDAEEAPAVSPDFPPKQEPQPEAIDGGKQP